MEVKAVATVVMNPLEIGNGSTKVRRPSQVTYLDNKERVIRLVKILKYSNFTLLFLTLCIIGIGGYLISSVGQFSNSLQSILATLLISSMFNLVGISMSICGQTTVAHEIALELRKSHSSTEMGLKKSDFDGRNTRGQMLILFGFYTGFIAGTLVHSYSAICFVFAPVYVFLFLVSFPLTLRL